MPWNALHGASDHLPVVADFQVPAKLGHDVAIAMGIDAMIHMVHAYQRMKKDKEHHLNDWLKVRRKMWEPKVIQQPRRAPGATRLSSFKSRQNWSIRAAATFL